MLKKSYPYYLLWILIAFPYPFAVSATLSHGSVWHANRLGIVALVIAVTAGAAVGGFSLVQRGRALAGGIIGLVVSVLLFLLLRPLASQAMPDAAFFTTVWNFIAGIITGGLSQRTGGEAGFVLNEKNLRWVSAALCTLRITH